MLKKKPETSLFEYGAAALPGALERSSARRRLLGFTGRYFTKHVLYVDVGNETECSLVWLYRVSGRKTHGYEYE